MNGLFTGLAVTAGFILGVRVGLALARREQKKKKKKQKA
jgi:hypothetical protein